MDMEFLLGVTVGIGLVFVFYLAGKAAEPWMPQFTWPWKR